MDTSGCLQNDWAKALFIILQALFWVALVATFSPSFAEISLAPIIVTAKKTAPALSTDAVTAKDIVANQYERVSDAIANIPGVYTSQYGSLGQLTSVFIRGGNSEHTSVLIDGMKANDPSTGMFNFAGLGTEGASTVAVLRGVSVADGGTDALSGVISIETRRGQNSVDDTTRFDTKLEGGSYDTYSIESGFEGKTGRADYHLRIIRDASHGSVTTPRYLQTIPRQAQPDPSDRTGFIARTGVQLNNTWRINMWNRTQSANDYSADPFYTNPARHSRTNSNFHRGEIETDLDRYKQKMGYSLALTERTNQSAYEPFSQSDTTKGSINTLYFKNEYQFTKAYTLLTQFTNEQLAQHSHVQFSDQTHHRALQQSAAIGHKINPVDAWHVELWARWHNHTAFKQYYSTKVKTDYTIDATRTTLLASYGTGIRAPSLSQLYAPKGGNASLNPEKSKGYDVGIEQDVMPKRLRIGTTYFVQNFDDLIVAIPITLTTSRYMNVSKAKTYGIESFVEAKLGASDTPPVTVRVEYTFLHAKDAVRNAQLSRRPMHKLTMHLLWQVTEPLLLGVGAVHYGKYADNDSVTYGRIYRKGPTVLRAWGSYAVNKKTDVFARVENATNCHYEYPEGFAAPGIACYGGVRVRGSF